MGCSPHSGETSLDPYDRLRKKWEKLSPMDATKELTWYYTRRRFQLIRDEFDSCFVDGPGDGGIDFCYVEDGTYHVLQAKYSGGAGRASLPEIMKEIRKMVNTIQAGEGSVRASEFLRSLKERLTDASAKLEFTWLTTRGVKKSIIQEVQKEVQRASAQRGWGIVPIFVAIDHETLQAVAYDDEHGVRTYTGDRELPVEEGGLLEFSSADSRIRAYAANVRLAGLLRWFSHLGVEPFLHKNVRGFLGEREVNREIRTSFLDDPAHFWFKHNGIIVFGERVRIADDKRSVTIRNPQIVNGGQTVSTIFESYRKDPSSVKESLGSVLIRMYEMPYDARAYETGLKVIQGLNSQTKIKHSDLRANDTRQVQLENLLEGLGFSYLRKKGGKRKSKYSIPMTGVATLYRCAKHGEPNIGVIAYGEEIFREDDIYDDVFNTREIERPMSADHVVVRFVTLWTIENILRKAKLRKIDANYRKYTRPYVVVDFEAQVAKWKRSHFPGDAPEWVNFATSPEFQIALTRHAQVAFTTVRKMVPRNSDPRKYLRSREANERHLARAKKTLLAKSLGYEYRRWASGY